MSARPVKARVVSCRGWRGDPQYQVLEILVEGVKSPYVTLSLPAVGYRALALEADAPQLFEKLAQAINSAGVSLQDKEVAGPL